VSELIRRFNRPIIAIVAVTAIGGAVRFWGLSSPHALVFDEFFYPKVACIYVGLSDRECLIKSGAERAWREQKWDVGSWVHPPLGKWEIALGIKAFGMNSFGWRVASAIAGTLVVAGVALMAQLLFGKPLWTFVAGLLIATEFLNVVQSRLGLLDVHLEMWIVAGFLALLLDRRWIERRAKAALPASVPTDAADGPAEPHPVPSPVWRPWRMAAGVAFGAAIAVKWSGLTALVGAVVLSYLWESTRRRPNDDATRFRAFRGAFVQETFGLMISLLLVPAAVYLAAWLPWFNHEGLSLLHHPVASISQWWTEQGGMARFHLNLKETDTGTNGVVTPTHPYYSRPWTWLPMVRPVSYFVRHVGADLRQIVAIGNPVIFWASAWTLTYSVYAWWHRRDWRAGFVLVGLGSQYLPWFAVSRPQFFFYVLPFTPFLVLAAVLTLHDLAEARLVLHDPETRSVAMNPETGAPAVSHRHPYRPFVWIYVMAAVGLFMWFWPVLVGWQLSLKMWHARIWFARWI
jgi:dolichyl-phosphate-mannose-protein mannosyltransferase